MESASYCSRWELGTANNAEIGITGGAIQNCEAFPLHFISRDLAPTPRVNALSWTYWIWRPRKQRDCGRVALFFMKSQALLCLILIR